MKSADEIIDMAIAQYKCRYSTFYSNKEEVSAIANLAIKLWINDGHHLYRAYRKCPGDTVVTVRDGYAGLHRILVDALEQAQSGKGAERHNLGGNIPFERQRMQQISQLIGSVDGMTYQACKKITEGVKLPTLERQTAELLGAINYIAGMIVWLRKQDGTKPAKKPKQAEPEKNTARPMSADEAAARKDMGDPLL